MNAAFERFLAGDDGLAALLQAQPGYLPPAHMDTWFAQAAQQAERARNSAAQDAAEREPFASMDAAVVASATQSDRNQAAPPAAGVRDAAMQETAQFKRPVSMDAPLAASTAQFDQTQVTPPTEGVRDAAMQETAQSEPPASMDARFFAAAVQADRPHTATPTDDSRDTTAQQFEPPSSMAAVFAAAAAQADLSQAARRAAIQERLGAGEDAAQALGAPVQDATRAWLQQLPSATGSNSTDGDARYRHDGAEAAASADDSQPAAQVANTEVSGPAAGDSTRSAGQATATAERTTNATTLDAAAAADALHAATPAVRRARRQRWMPALALAASVTLAVGVGLHWQATAPLPAPPVEAARVAVQEPADQLNESQSAPVAASPAGSDSASAFEDGLVAERSPAPPPLASMPPPVSAKPSAAFAAPPSPAPSASPAPPAPPAPMAALPEPMVAAPAPPMPAAPMAAIANADVDATQPLSAERESVATTNRSAQQTTHERPNAAAPPSAHVPGAPLPAIDTRQRSLAEAGKSPPSIQADSATPAAQPSGLLSRTPPKTAPLKAPAAQQRQADDAAAMPDEATAAPAAASQPISTSRLATSDSAQQRAASAAAAQLLPLSSAPGDWIDRHLHAGHRAPTRLRLEAATPDAPEVRRWVDQLRTACRDRGWSTQIEIAPNAQLPADRLRIEVQAALSTD
ncbi:hypothetical protein [Xanthomonas floridensis]|uniref:Antifreeze glycopeptide AFGP related protein n=1 Tax=Xanthomonas floridensis TaxID=1843580 RepID=A0A1A9MI16_9XANT|nr:hypothetical protein [Xanthomonas floridensis]MEA5124506.1 hypothetical protein [Xanthomonas floridensis]MEA5130280.1 hypothetical protein [Xanthomonas floridensis]OAG69466.1 hypothetical protein A7D17_01245 [Xanthomonas floridensis]